LFVGGFACFSSCFNDQGTEESNPVPEIVIDTTGIQVTHTVLQYDRLKISPKVYLKDAAGDFSYKWMLNVYATTSDADPNSIYVCIGEEMELDAVIDLVPNSQTYFLWYQVTDNQSGFRKDILWRVLVKTAFGAGLLVADTRDGVTSDLSLIESSLFTAGWKVDDKVTYNLYSAANGAPLEGVTSILHYGYGTVYMLGDGFYEALNSNTYERFGRNLDLSFNKDLPLSFTQLNHWISQNEIYMVTGGKLFFFLGIPPTQPMEWMPSGPYINSQNLFTIPPDPTVKESTIDKYVASRYSGYYNGVDMGVMWYDRGHGCFLWQSNASELATVQTFPVAGAFDPTHAPGLRTLWAQVGFNNRFIFIMKNENTGANELYLFRHSPAESESVATIPGTEINDAVAYVVPRNADLFYFATKSKIYSVTFGAGAPQVTLQYTIPSGEITCFTMFRQSFLATAAVPTEETVLLLGTADGTLYYLPIASPSAGILNTGGIKTFNGFGKITGIAQRLAY